MEKKAVTKKENTSLSQTKLAAQTKLAVNRYIQDNVITDFSD